MPGLVPGIHVFATLRKKDVDGRDEPGHDGDGRNNSLATSVFSSQRRLMMTKPLKKTIKPVPEDNKSHKGPGSTPQVPVDTTKGHRDDEKQNIREQAEHGNVTQHTSNPRTGGGVRCLRAAKPPHSVQRPPQL